MFQPMMTLYLTLQTTPDDIKAAAADGLVKAVKWYPAGATTNSGAGVKETDLERVLPTLEAMAEVRCGCCVCVCVFVCGRCECTHAHPNSRTHLQEQVGMPLLCHGESTDPCSDVFDREAKWVREV